MNLLNRFICWLSDLEDQFWWYRLRNLGRCNVAINVESGDAWCNTHHDWADDGPCGEQAKRQFDYHDHNTPWRHFFFSLRCRLGFV